MINEEENRFKEYTIRMFRHHDATIDRLVTAFFSLSALVFMILAYLIITGLTAEAQTIPTDVVIVRHSLATVTEQRTMAKLGLARTKSAGVNQPINKITITKDLCLANSTKEYTNRGFDCWKKLAYKKGWCSKSSRCHVLKPPVVDKGIDYGGGVAQGLCTVNSGNDFSYAIARTQNGKGLPRVGMSINVIAHENGHNNGAEHEEEDLPFVMHPDAGKYGNVPLSYSLFSKELIDICMLEVGLRKTSFYGFRLFTKVTEDLIN